MSVICPHCRRDVLAGSISGTIPEWCPYCAHVMDEPPADDVADDVESLGKFLRSDPTPEQERLNVTLPKSNHSSGFLRKTKVAAGDVAQATQRAPSGTFAPLELETVSGESGSVQHDFFESDEYEFDDEVGFEADTAFKPETNAVIGDDNSVQTETISSPSFAKPRPLTVIPVSQWVTLSVLIVMLAFQWVIADRNRFANSPTWRPALEKMCGVLHCQLPVWHQPQAYTMLARDVKKISDAPSILEVNATFRNDARWPQSWPNIALSIFDINGSVAGARVLTPSDYLNAELQGTTLIPGQSGQLNVRVYEPAEEGTSVTFEDTTFTLEFR